MQTFKEFYQTLQEALVTFGNKSYPRFGHIVILAGGAGSGKGFVLKNLIGIEGKVLDVDATKELARNTKTLVQKIKKETGEDISKMSLKNPDNVSKLHVLLKKVIDDKDNTFFKSVRDSHPERKPNIIFDVTMKDWKKFHEITAAAEVLGYDKKNVHLVWIVNSMEIAKEQNRNRDRVVPENILIQTHEGASNTFKDVIDMGNQIARWLNGDIWIVMNNKSRGDSLVKTSKSGGMYIEKDTKVKLKKAGEPTISAIPKLIASLIKKDTGNKRF